MLKNTNLVNKNLKCGLYILLSLIKILFEKKIGSRNPKR